MYFKCFFFQRRTLSVSWVNFRSGYLFIGLKIVFLRKQIHESWRYLYMHIHRKMKKTIFGTKPIIWKFYLWTIVIHLTVKIRIRRSTSSYENFSLYEFDSKNLIFMWSSFQFFIFEKKWIAVVLKFVILNYEPDVLKFHDAILNLWVKYKNECSFIFKFSFFQVS